ncbi:hypothetical protein BCR34DRAFT_602393 [Clohesyomyces aquaticus]|uniref:Uncharacterized protein n=1 Tax=Clohesyomyces aquaticus TaxID=1231657 RepID=A0A1Y1ZIK0_9PLEO|nr:hypothetical protein BCR34DRAFT_602393 [Clohesyomyces aquaticus]
MDKIFDATSYLADRLARYASIERNFGHRSIGDWESLQGVVIKFSAEILRYVAEVLVAQESPISKRAVQGFRTLTVDALGVLKEQVHNHEFSSEKWLIIVAQNSKSYYSAPTNLSLEWKLLLKTFWTSSSDNLRERAKLCVHGYVQQITRRSIIESRKIFILTLAPGYATWRSSKSGSRTPKFCSDFTDNLAVGRPGFVLPS